MTQGTPIQKHYVLISETFKKCETTEQNVGRPMIDQEKLSLAMIIAFQLVIRRNKKPFNDNKRESGHVVLPC